MDEIGVEYSLIAGSILGAVRSRSIAFCDDDIDIAVFGKEAYEHVVTKLPKICKERKLGAYVKRPWPGADRVRPHARPYLTLDIFALRKYADLGEVRETVRWKDNGNEQSSEYVGRIMEKLENARFPLYHFDNRKSIELWPSEYFEIGELRPLKRYEFGHLYLSGPARPLRYLERSYGSNCFKEWKYADSHMSHSKELAKRVEEIGIIPGSTGPMQEVDYAKVCHSKHRRQNFGVWDEKSMESWIAEEREWHNEYLRKRDKWFGFCMRSVCVGGGGLCFDDDTLDLMEPHIKKARKRREEVQSGCEKFVPSSVAWGDVYQESDYAIDTSFNFVKVLTECLGVKCLEEIDEASKEEAVTNLLSRERRVQFHGLFHSFILKFVARKLEEFGIEVFKFQDFPCVRIIRHSEFSLGPHCDCVYGHPPTAVNFILPLTNGGGSECLHLESEPGREDWHRVNCGVGWVKSFWGAQCLHWTGENWSGKSRVSLDFRVIPNGGDGGELYDSDEGYYGIARKGPDGIWRLDGEEGGGEVSRLVGFPFSSKAKGGKVK